MSAIESLATLYLEGRQAEMGPLFFACVKEEGRTDTEIAYAIYLALYARGDHAQALQFLLGFCGSFAGTNQLLLLFGKKLFAEQDRGVAANLLMVYIDSDGREVESYILCVDHCMAERLYEHATAIYAKFRARFDDQAATTAFLNNVGTAFMVLGKLEEAFRLFERCLTMEPDYSTPRMNMRHMAVKLLYPPAIDFMRSDHDYIAGFPLAARPTSSDGAGVELRWTGAESAAILNSLMKNGFCLIRGGCEITAAAEILAHLKALSDAGAEFPIGFTPEIRAKLAGLFRFDPAAIIERVAGRPFQIDPTLCVARRVTPDRAHSFVPFHQDSSAFSKPLFNVWTPMTPAGGAYPSVQFVRKLVTVAEQTKLFEGEYNLIEIDADFIQAKYGDLLFEVTDAAPGDCVMFYGTTIHRSCNLERATETRFNIETRWSAV